MARRAEDAPAADCAAGPGDASAGLDGSGGGLAAALVAALGDDVQVDVGTSSGGDGGDLAAALAGALGGDVQVDVGTSSGGGGGDLAAALAGALGGDVQVDVGTSSGGGGGDLAAALAGALGGDVQVDVGTSSGGGGGDLAAALAGALGGDVQLAHADAPRPAAGSQDQSPARSPDGTVEDLASTLMEQIRASDWLEQNPASGDSIFDLPPAAPSSEAEAAAAAAETEPLSGVDGLAATLIEQIRASDWLEQNPASGESIFAREDQ